jgi:hypothetical protein
MSENKNGNHRFGSDNVLDRGMPHGHPANEKMAPSKSFKVEVSLWLARLKIILLVLFYMLPWYSCLTKQNDVSSVMVYFSAQAYIRRLVLQNIAG